MSQNKRQAVKRRRVFYVPGYDPIHPRRYRELYRSEGAAQESISGYEITLSPKTGAGNYGWDVNSRIDDAEVSAGIEVLVWSDIVRGSMETNIPGTYVQLVRTSWTYIASGALRRLMWLRKGPVIAALYPIVMLSLQLIASVFLGGLLGSGLRGLAAALSLPVSVGQLLYFLAIVATVFFGTRWFKSKDAKIYAYYLMHDYAYSAHYGGANPPELEERMSQFGDMIADALQDDLDEVLVVGHSSGAHLGVSILADLVRQGRVPKQGPDLGFLTLGQVVPMVSFLPKAYRLRADLQYLSTRDELAWVDVTAPGDGCSFALCDPVAVSGVATKDQKWPLVFSAAFSQSLTPETWKVMRRRYFRLHFQYLCAFDRPRDYDYFQITAGPQTLRDRYAARAPSKSRIVLPASKFKSITA